MSLKSKQQQENGQTEAWGHCFSMNDRKKRTALHKREKVLFEMREIKQEKERERPWEREIGLLEKQEELQTINMLILFILHSYVVYEAVLPL